MNSLWQRLSHLNKAHLLSVIGNIGTAVVTFVPAWGPEEKIIVATLGGVVSNVYPLVAAIHRLVDVVVELVTAHKITLSGLRQDAVEIVHTEAGKVNYAGLLDEALQQGGLQKIEKQLDEMARQAFANVFGPSQGNSMQSATLSTSQAPQFPTSPTTPQEVPQS